MHECWQKYQFFQFKLIKKAESKKQNEAIKKYLQRAKGKAYVNIGFIYDDYGNTPLALKYYFLALKTFEKSNSLEGMVPVYMNLGAIYDNQEDTSLALKYYHKSLSLAKKLDKKKETAIALNNIGSLYRNINNYDKALVYFKEALIINEEINDIQNLAYSYGYLGLIYKVKKEDDLALDYFKKSIVIRKKIGDKKGTIHSLNNIGIMMSENGNLKVAEENFLEALNISKETKYAHGIMTVSLQLSNFYYKQHKAKEALEMFKQYIKIRDHLKNESTQKEIIQQQAKYEYEKQKVIDDAEHEKQIAIEQEAAEKQTILTYATAGGLGLVGIFLLIVFNRLKVTRKQKNIIEEQKQEVEQQKEEVELAHSELEEKNKEITDSIQYAKRIQNAILPPTKVVKEYLSESFIYYKPKDIVAGDFYWMEAPPSLPEGEGNKTICSPPSGELEGAIVLFAAADCTGHGVPGAMVSVVCNNGLNRSVREYGLTDPGKILDKTREIVVQEFEKSEEEVKDGMDIALCSLQSNSPFEGGERGMTLKYAGAHNPLWVIRKDSKEIEEIKANKQPIGKFDNPEPYTTHTLELQKGDSIYIFSDGYADQFGGEKGKKLKTTNFKKLLLSIQNETMDKQKQLIDEAFEDWKGNLEQLDDVCVIGVRI